MEEKFRMTQSLRPRSRPPRSAPPRPRKLKAAAATIVVREPRDRLTDSPAQSKVALPALKPVRQSPQPRLAAPDPVVDAQPGPVTTYPGNIDVEALTKNLARLVEEGGRALAAYLKPREDGASKI